MRTYTTISISRHISFSIYLLIATLLLITVSCKKEETYKTDTEENTSNMSLISHMLGQRLYTYSYYEHTSYNQDSSYYQENVPITIEKLNDSIIFIRERINTELPIRDIDENKQVVWFGASLGKYTSCSATFYYGIDSIAIDYHSTTPYGGGKEYVYISKR